ncbi:MAG: hypothetical protein P0Y65_14675 [Candidatus Devosia phytovorans]|uniref:Uncharacterized protein n=1 Tax=Candidatus Devosia phytovorans TaxID=3121372 RepID=A0AAJ5VSF7_9HYPH|nr:hypothetical protein [Devosia sp.]WEK03432.1 MAG: hypothetical protein P0Y65_14675 [Devosia sp.]
MSGDRDPFELMPRFVDPEPDPVTMNATIAQSREAFATRKVQPHATGPVSLAEWLSRSARWLVPAGAMAVALVAVIVATPSLTMTSPDRMANQQVADSPVVMPPASTSLSRGDEQVADMPAEEITGRRMGMTAPPATQQASAEPLPQVVSSFQGDGVRLELRLDAEALEIYLPELSGAQMVDAQSVMPGEMVEILAAFLQPDRALMAIQIRVGDLRFWRIYQLVDRTYRRDPERSTLVSDAPDRAEVERRLAAE